MIIKSKVYIAGIAIFMVFTVIAMMNLMTYREIISNTKTRDEVNQRLEQVEEVEKWRNNLIQATRDIVASGIVPLSTFNFFLTTPELPGQEYQLLQENGKDLIGLVKEKENITALMEKTHNELQSEINSLYTSLDGKIATVLARAQMNQILGIESTEQIFLAPYVLKCLNQLTLVAMNTLISMNYTEESRSIVEKNRHFIQTQIEIIDSDEGISELFEALFLQINTIDIFIRESNEQYARIESEISEAEDVFNSTAEKTELYSIILETRHALDEANINLENTSLRTLITVVIFVFILPVIIISLGIYSMNRLIVKPITSLTLYMKEIETGNFDVKVPVKSRDEVGILASSFNMMAEEINEKVTELSRLNRILHENEQKYRLLANNLPHRIFHKNIKSEFISCNKKFAEDLGISEEEIQGKTDFDFFPDDLSQKYRTDDGSILSAGRSKEIEEEYILNGDTIIVQTIKTPVRNKNGEITGLLGIFWDITKRKQAELELKKARNYIANIINSMPSVLIGVDSKGIITQWNDEARKITGIYPEKAVGHSLEEAFPYLVRELENVRKAIKTRQTITSAGKSRWNENEILYEDITIFPLITNGEDGAVIRIDNITEKVRLEEMMIQSEKMLSVGGLAAGMAHEINNPLAGILQTAEVMISRLGSDLDIPASRKAAEKEGISLESIKNYMESRGIIRMLDTILDSGRRVAEIVNNMLSFARKTESSSSTNSIEELLDRTLELAATDYDLKKNYDFRQIAILKKYDENPRKIPCKSSKIQQVLLNILRNGAQAMDEAHTENPRFILHTRYEEDRRMVTIEIEDNGPGMAEETRKRVFEPFFTTKATGSGTGLGLSVSYFIITEDHNGEMTVESQPGFGTKFIIRLPVEG